MNKLLLLVDGSSYLYRAFHAMPDLRNHAGEPTGALYGVLNMLKRLRVDHQADFLACIFDAPGKTFRDDLLESYKANRSAMPEDLVAQIEPIHQAIRALGWPLLCVSGVEADDIIATLAAKATHEGIDTIISTGDKDLAQLVNSHVTLVNTMTNEKLDEPGVLAKFSVQPKQIVDYLMLVGDAVDNVPGVPKVGPKTAVKWLQQYGSLENIIAHSADIPGVVGANLRQTLDFFPLSRELITVKTDCALPPELTHIHTLVAHSPDKQALAALYDRYGFRSWLRELQGASAPKAADAQPSALTHGPTAPPLNPLFANGIQEFPVPPVHLQYDTILEWSQFEDWLARIKQTDLVALDTETTSLSEMKAKLVGISLAIAPGQACYIPLTHRYPGVADQLPIDLVLEHLKPWLEDPKRLKVLQHAKYDAHVFANHGIALQGIAHDTMLQAYVLESHLSTGLHQLTQRWLGIKGVAYEDICGKGANQIGFDEVDIATASHYSAEDSDFTLRLHHTLYPKIQAQAALQTVYNIEIQVSRVLTIIERNGVRVDSELLAVQSHQLGQQMLALEQKAYQAAGQPFNLNSPKQLGEILFDQLKLPVVKKTSGGAPSTDEEVLNKLAEDYPLPKLLLEYRGMAKLKNTYTDKLPLMINPQTGRIHTSYAQAAVVTGRLASSEPNLQNIPVRNAEGRRIREAFIAAPGKRIVSADYSQIELRIMAHLSGDQSLCHAFAQGEDIHRATAAEIFSANVSEVTSEQRRYAKVINFGLIYGMSSFGLAQSLGISRDAAKNYIDRYFARYPGVARYMEETRQKAHHQGYVETVFGRRLWLAEINSQNAQRRQGAERAAINAPMQGTAADLIKLAMIAVQDWIEQQQLHSQLIMQVHDELLLEVPENELDLVKNELPKHMCNVAQLAVPLEAEVGIGMNWEQAH